MNFMNNAPDFVYLVAKVILVFGICGGLKCDELTELKVQDVEDLNNRFLVSIVETKNDKPRQFIVGELFYGKIKEYILLRPSESFTDRFFIQYHNGKCQRQNIGKNKIDETPQVITSYLNLSNPKLYTEHCFRRTGTTLLSDSGANITMLKRLGGWKSTSIAQGYVENSLKNREKIFDSIIHAAKPSDQLNPQPSTSGSDSTAIINKNMNKKSQHEEAEFDCFDDFDINDQDLAVIDELSESQIPESPTPFFTSAKSKKILTCNNQSQSTTHFSFKSSVIISSTASENIPPSKTFKSDAKTHAYNQSSDFSPVKTTADQTTCNMKIAFFMATLLIIFIIRVLI
ncbi:uncharacterized protein LOC130666104 [Microplitis mediator]|uniref:uncharacterized protein LOC130666104 n=1 Tax=Microplitis mediator TaxID=375433 RepID=UPI0025521E44|nr:uncharacterized protein LOC130666104 [Microplitis mediator]